MGAVSLYSNVYNYYVSTPTGRRQANKYDTHKESELKDVYHSIVRISRESPVYIFDRSADTFKYAINIKEEASELKNTLSALSSKSGDGSMLGQKIASSSDPDALEAKFFGTLSDAEASENMSVAIDQLASPQVNVGNYLPQSRLKLIPNNYAFDIQTGGLSYEFQFKVSHQDTNRTIQDRLAALINKSNIGLHADIATDEESGFTALRLTSDTTGSQSNAPIFNITDEHSSLEKGAVDYLGLNKVASSPQNAKFRINGSEHSSASNSFTINRSFEFNLKQVTPEDHPVTIRFKEDIDTVSDNIKEMTRQYNSVLRLAGSHAKDQIQNNLLQRNLSSAVRAHANSLESIGLSLNDNGMIQVDDQLLGQALTEDMTDTVDSLMAFNFSLKEKTEEVILNPMDYIDKKIVAYPNPGKTFSNPYVTSIYSGMLFNGYC